MRWFRSHRADPVARVVADRHYNRQKIGTPQFVPPGHCLVLLTKGAGALWVTSWPFAEYVSHAWGGAWVNSAFRNEARVDLSSELIREAIAATRSKWPDVPVLGLVTFIDAAKVKSKRDPGRCYERAGFKRPACPRCGGIERPFCSTCTDGNARTKGGLIVWQLLPADMPPACAPVSHQVDFFEALR